MYQETPWVIIPEKFDMMHIMPASDHIWNVLTHNSSTRALIGNKYVKYVKSIKNQSINHNDIFNTH